LLEAEQVLMHPFVMGELALGHLGPRQTIMSSLNSLPQAVIASPAEVLQLIERHRLFGSGIGYVDAHLLAAARLMASVPLWTCDRRLHAIAGGMGLAHGSEK
jgi:hypothetical protein